MARNNKLKTQTNSDSDLSFKLLPLSFNYILIYLCETFSYGHLMARFNGSISL